MNFEQLREYKPQLKRLARKYGIKKLYVFGSIARGESRIQSDVDFLVEMKPGSSLFGVGGFGYEAQHRGYSGGCGSKVGITSDKRS